MEFVNALIEASTEPVAISRPEKEKQANRYLFKLKKLFLAVPAE